jgi:hypothetical protein
MGSPINEADVAWPVNETITYLTERNPIAVTELKEHFPKFSSLLQPGMTMGRGEDESSSKHTGKAVFIANLLAVALLEAESDVDQKLKLARENIARANKYQSWSQYLALLMSGTTLGLIGFEISLAAKITSIAAVMGPY